MIRVGIKCFISAVLIVSVSWTMPAHGEEYYVDPGGNDSNPGTEAQPWQNIGQAAADMTAGDTVYIKAGTYSERVVPENSGDAGNYITYTAYPGDTVTIDGEGVSIPYDPPWGGIVDMRGKSYIRISGLRVINSTSTGIFVWDSSSDIIIEGNYTYNTVSSGIGVWSCDHITIDGNEVELACHDGGNECISVSGTDLFEIKNNHVHHGGPGSSEGAGIDAKGGCSNGEIFGNELNDLMGVGIYVDAWDRHTFTINVYGNISYNNPGGYAVSAENGGLTETIRIFDNIAYDNEGAGFWVAGWGVEGEEHPLRDIEVFGNISHDNGDGFAVAAKNGSFLEDVKIYNNIIYHNKLRGLRMDGIDEQTGAVIMRDIKIVNNTFYDNGTGDWGGGIIIKHLVADNVVVRNNIFSDNLSFQIAVGSDFTGEDFTVDFNLIDGYRGNTDEIYGDNYVEADPGFVNPDGADFHLMETSPAIDAASPVDAPGHDFDGNVRPHGAGYDIGAFEYTTAAADDVEPFMEGADPMPDPADGSVDVMYDAPSDTSLEDEGVENGGGSGCGCRVVS